MATMVPLPAESKEVAVRSTDREDDDKAFKNFIDKAQYRSMVMPSLGFIMVNYMIVFCLLLSSQVQLSAWASKFENSSDAAVEEHFSRMQMSHCICGLLILLAPISHTLCVYGFWGSIKLLRLFALLEYVQIIYFSMSFSILFVVVLCPSPKAQTMITSIFQDEYSASHLPNSVFLLECVSIVVTIQHAIIIFALHRCKPPDFEYFRYSERKANKVAPPPLSEVRETPIPVGREVLPPPEAPSQAQENDQEETFVLL